MHWILFYYLFKGNVIFFYFLSHFKGCIDRIIKRRKVYKIPRWQLSSHHHNTSPIDNIRGDMLTKLLHQLRADAAKSCGVSQGEGFGRARVGAVGLPGAAGRGEAALAIPHTLAIISSHYLKHRNSTY